MTERSRLPRPFDRYLLKERIGRGGFGEVFLACDVETKRPLALKILHDWFGESSEMATRLFREARAVSLIDSPHVARIVRWGLGEQARPFIAMELLHGHTLDAELEGGPVPVERALSIGLQLLDGLTAAHQAGIVHRDLKPANVFLVADEDGEELVKILDFGLSKVTFGSPDALVTSAGRVMGTPAYMAPEQSVVGGTIDHRCDLYAAGAVLYHLLSGRPPRDVESYRQLSASMRRVPLTPLRDVAPWVAPGIATLIERALLSDPDARWPSADAFAVALRAELYRSDPVDRSASADRGGFTFASGTREDADTHEVDISGLPPREDEDEGDDP